jgi:hypothetical protein
MMDFEREEDVSLAVAWRDCRRRGCTIRLGEYVLITCAAWGSQMTWDWRGVSFVVH